MSREFINGNVVVTAEQFNPTIVSQLWLAKKGIVPDDGFREGCIFADTVAQVRARDFDLLVIPQMAQFVPTVEPQLRQHTILEKMGALIRELPETPFRALGINLLWHVVPATSTIEDLCRRLFWVADGPIHRFFEDGQSRFGAYLSKDSHGFRLKLTALPMLFPPIGKDTQHVIGFNFNYHFDIPADSDKVATITQKLADWNDVVQESQQIVEAAGE
jgi:hypothetical protein